MPESTTLFVGLDVHKDFINRLFDRWSYCFAGSRMRYALPLSGAS
jgi:hypothetical protein